MDAWFEIGLAAARWLQANYPSLAQGMQWVSQLGRFELYLALIPVIYWCLNKQLGSRLLYVLALTNVITLITKHIVAWPRPFWLEPDVALAAAEGFGFPSGHAAAATATFLLLAVYARRAWTWLLALVWVGLMALSRVYLGVHFIHDVVGGILLGVLILIGYGLWLHYAFNRFNRRIMGQRLLLMMLPPTLLLSLYLPLVFLLPERALLADGTIYTTARHFSWEDSTAAFALLYVIGPALTLERSRVRFRVNGPWWQRVARYLLGIFGIVLLWLGLDLLFVEITPEGAAWMALPLRFVRYALIAWWGVYYAPFLFVRLRLAGAMPRPEVVYTVSDRSLPAPRSNGEGAPKREEEDAPI